MYKEVVEKKIAESMKNGDQQSVDLWRAIKSEFLLFEKAKPNNVITDDVEFKIISKMLQQRKDDIVEYKNAGREKNVLSLQRECEILEVMLPKEPSDQEINNAIDEFISSKGDNYSFSMKDMKDAQNYVKSKFALVNGGKVAQIFKTKLN